MDATTQYMEARVAKRLQAKLRDDFKHDWYRQRFARVAQLQNASCKPGWANLLFCFEWYGE